jgi:hypothetical protein
VRRALTFAAVAAAGIAAGVAYDRRHTRRRARLDIYFDDGSFVTYVEGSSEAARLLPLAHDVLEATR